MSVLSDLQRELLEDKFLLWGRQARKGPAWLRDYSRRAAEALQVALAASAEAGEAARLRAALGEIAVGAGVYGAQAREYKNIARVALGMAPL